MVENCYFTLRYVSLKHTWLQGLGRTVIKCRFPGLDPMFGCMNSVFFFYFHFHTTTPTAPPIPTSHPPTCPLWLCPCVLYTRSLMALPLCSPINPFHPPLWLLLVLYFNVSGYIYLGIIVHSSLLESFAFLWGQLYSHWILYFSLQVFILKIQMFKSFS